MTKRPAHTFATAPMMDWTDRNCRLFHRSLSRHALLYTEMVTAEAVLHGDLERLLAFSPQEHPVALQLGGSDPEKLARAAAIGAGYGYDEINLNVGCPSERVQSGAFGACLMREPKLVSDCLAAMRAASSVPVTIKHRIGVDDDVPEQTLFPFVEEVRRSGVTCFIVHARKAILKGLSPKENRSIPPLDYAIVADLKREFPDLTIILNGGLTSVDDVSRHLNSVDGVMFGRAAYQSPALLLDVDRKVFNDPAATRTPETAAREFRPAVLEFLATGAPLNAMTRHMLGLFSGVPGARNWRRILSERAPGARGVDAIAIYDDALNAVCQPVIAAG